MTIVYELNPPRLDYGGGNKSKDELYEIMLNRASKIVGIADGIHITDAVLGTQRLGALESCVKLFDISGDMKITMSIRTRDRTFEQIADLVEQAARTGISGVLLIRGDPPQQENAPDSGLYPGGVLARLRKEDRTCGLLMLLSLASDQTEKSVQKKIASSPDGFVTQVIASESEALAMIERISVHNIGVMPCVMLPSAKNAKSASFLGLDWSAYENDPAEFVRRIEKIAGSVLITSPNDIAMAQSVLEKTSTRPLDDGQ